MLFSSNRMQLQSAHLRSHCPVCVRHRGPFKNSYSRAHNTIRAQNSEPSSSSGSTPFGLLLECDGVVVDAHTDGHRVAFNKAFEQLGLSMIKWKKEMYNKLLSAGDGSAEGMMLSYFNTVGWPSTYPKEKRKTFIQDIHNLKKKALENMVLDAKIPLRKGVERLIDDALADGVRVGLLTATSSTAEERIADAAMAALGDKRAAQMSVFSCFESSVGAGGLDAAEERAPQSFEQELAALQAKAKAEVGASFVKTILDMNSTTPLSMDSGLVAAAYGAGSISPSFLRAVCAALGSNASHSALVTTRSSIMQAAQGANLLSVAVPTSLSARGLFTNADLSFDGFGPGGGATWRSIVSKLRSRV